MPNASSFPVVNVHFLDIGHNYDYYDKRRSNFQPLYGQLLAREPALNGRIIDIGCGHGDNPAYKFYSHLIGQLDGVDPFPVTQPTTILTNRWTCSLEDLPVSDETYDLAYSYNVVEHVKDVDSFLRKALAIIKPGACYWSMCPNYHHPFAKVTRFIQNIGLLNLYRNAVNAKANDYPAYYALSREQNILNSIKKQSLPVSKIDFYYIHNVQWDTYFPKYLRGIPHFLDDLWLLSEPKRAFIFMFRIEKTSSLSD